MAEGEQADQPEAIDAAVRGQLAAQMSRLNTNLERQFSLIEGQQQRERRASRRRWRIVMGVVLLIGLGNVRVEQVRREGDRRVEDAAAATALESCRRTNLGRAEIRDAFDQQGEALVAIAAADQKPKATMLVQETHDRLAASLKSSPCSGKPRDAYESCAAARADGATPLYRGVPGYSAALDKDGDGIACE